MTISKAAAVRLALCEFENPATADASKAAMHATQRFGVKVTPQDVHGQRNYLRKQKVIMTPEGILRFCRGMGDPPPTTPAPAPAPSAKVKNKRKSIRHPDVPPRSFFIREAILEMNDFQSASTQRITVLARAKAAHAGFRNLPINGDDVRCTITWLKERLGNPLAHEKIRDYHERSKSTLEARKLIADRAATSNGQPDAPVPTSSLIESLKRANRIARSFGGVDEAIAILSQLKEVLA